MKITTQDLFIPYVKSAAFMDTRIPDYLSTITPLGLGHLATGALRGKGKTDEEGEPRTGEGALKGWLGGLGGAYAGGSLGALGGGLAGLGLGSAIGGGLSSAQGGEAWRGALAGGGIGGYSGIALGLILGSILGGAEGGRYLNKDLINRDTESEEETSAEKPQEKSEE